MRDAAKNHFHKNYRIRIFTKIKSSLSHTRPVQVSTSSMFHEKYGNAIMASGILFCVSVWTYVCTQADIPWGWSPVGRVTPKPYNN
uniref:Cytochrome c oxidase subunit 7B, mitochondrial n=1 Tax=Eptatretus burgeri TaxID=7764 RepID=A0A8C4NDS8_EPTBU